MSISYADMREIVAIEHKGESHKEGEDLDQFIDCMTKIRMEQHTKIEDKVESLLNQLVFPDEMIVKMSKALSPKKKKIKFNIKKVEEEEEDIREKISLWLSNSDCDDDFNTFVYFLVDECGVVLKQEEEEEEYCECSFPSFIINDGIQSCSKCSKTDHYKSGVVADHSDEEEVEEELDICGETGRKFDEGNPLKGCGKKITEDDENLMIGNISYCLSCVENSEEEVISEWHEAQGR